MTLRRKTFILLTVTSAVLLLALCLTARAVLVNSAIRLEEQHTRDHVERALNALSDSLSTLDALVWDWASWDDTYAFVEDRNQAYVDSNFVTSTFTGLNLNLILLFDTEGKMLLGKAVDLQQEEEMDIPEGLWAHLSQDGLLLGHATPERHVAGIVLLPEASLLLASRPILTSEDEGPVRGTLIMGRYLDEAEVGHLAKVAHLSLAVQRVGDPQLPPEFQEARAALVGPSDVDTVFVRPLDTETVAGYALLRDVYGEPALLLQVRIPREIYAQGITALRYVVASLLIVGVTFSLIFVFLVERLVLTPLAALSSWVERLGEKRDLSARLEVEGQDELASLARSINRTLSDLEESEKARHESEAQYRNLVERANDGITIVQDGLLKYVNPRLAEMLGYSVEEMTGTSFTVYIHPDELGKVSERYERRMRGEKVPPVYETILVRKDGSKVEAELNAGINWYQGQRADFVFVQDVTERHAMERELLKTRQLESIGVLAGGIAHDFNNILTAILGNVSLAKMYASAQEDIYEALTKAEKASLRARELTQQLLTFSKGGAPVKKIASVADLVRDSAEFALRGSRVRCQFSPAEGLWPVEVDEGQISRVIQNLVINAREAMPQGGTIQVCCENVTLGSHSVLPLPKGRYVRISLTDQGTGIPQEHLARIFEPYFTTKQAGHGLGLTTAFSIVKQHGGHITVDSELGRGTTFCVYLPASHKAVSAAEAVEKGPAVGEGRVLLVDNEEDVRETAGSMLRHLGYQIAFARDGMEALRVYQEARASGQPFDAVIMDLTIPGGMGGKEAVQKLLEADPGARVVVSSGYSTDPVVANFKEHGFCGCLAKPYQMEDLGRVLREALRAR